MAVAPAYISVPVFLLIGDVKVDFDLYLLLKGKYILYIRTGSTLDAERYKKLIDKTIKNLWVVAADEPRVRRLLEKRLEQAYHPNSGLKNEIRCLLIRGTLRVAIDAVFKLPQSVAPYLQLKARAKRFADFYLQDSQALKIMFGAKVEEKSIELHGVNVAALTLEIIKRSGKADLKNLHLVVIGSLLHDVGHYVDLKVGFAKPVSKMSIEELEKFKQHPLTGAKVFSGISHVEPLVLNIIHEHEETIDGKGYPRGMTMDRLSPFSVIVAVANAYDQLVFLEGAPPTTALQFLKSDCAGAYPGGLIAELVEISKIIHS